MTNEREKVCPKCKMAFSCYTTNCWCAELPNIIPLIDGAECYCPTCLKEVIDQFRDFQNLEK